MTEQPTTFDRALGGYVAVVLVLLFIAFGGCGGLVSEVRTAMRNGQTGAAQAYTLPAAPLPPGAVNTPVPIYLPRASQPPAPVAQAPPAADPYRCVNGKNPYGLDCGLENGSVHVYPPAHPDQPCQQADGAIRFTRITETGNTETFTRAPQWSSDRSTYTVILPGGAAPVLFVGPPPACGGAP